MRKVKMHIGARIAELRREAGLNQIEFAAGHDVSLSALKNYERGASDPSVKFLTTLCNEYNVSADWLLLGHGQSDASLPNVHVRRASERAFAFVQEADLNLTSSEFAEVVELLFEYYLSHEDPKPKMEQTILQGFAKRSA